jgi:hypothetical protein
MRLAGSAPPRSDRLPGSRHFLPVALPATTTKTLYFGYDRGHAIQGVHMYYGIGLGTLVVIVVVLLLLF